MKKNSGKRTFFTLTVIILCCAVVLAVIKFKDSVFIKDILDKFSSNQSQSEPESTSSQNDPLEQLAINSPTAQAEYKNGILKIDEVFPSLDTCTMKIHIYDVKNKKMLSTLNFEDAAWVTGLTKNGYYAIDTLNKTVFLYDNSGKKVYEKVFESDAMQSQATAVSYDEKSIAYVDSKDGIIYVYNRESDKTDSAKTKFAVREIMSFENGKITVLGIDGQTAEIAADNFKTTVISDVKDCSYKSRYYSLGMTENNFKYSSSDKTVYIPFEYIDEIITGMGKDAFTTTVMKDNTYLIRVYSLKDEKVYETEIAENPESIVFADDNIFVLCGNPQEEKHKISKINYKKSNSKNFKISNKDIAADDETQQDENIKAATPTSGTKIIENVPIIKQFPKYPTGCESVSTVMAMQYHKTDISVKEFIDGYLPQSSEYYISDGKKYGPSPYEVFIGKPTSKHSYGCMAPVIESALKKYYGNDAEIINTTGTGMSVLCETYINNDIPVIVWATINMKKTAPTNSWYLSDGTRFTWPGNEHCMVLVGFDSDNYYFNDPYSGQLTKYNKSLSESRYNELGKQSLVIK